MGRDLCLVRGRVGRLVAVTFWRSASFLRSVGLMGVRSGSGRRGGFRGIDNDRSALFAEVVQQRVGFLSGRIVRGVSQILIGRGISLCWVSERGTLMQVACLRMLLRMR